MRVDTRGEDLLGFASPVTLYMAGLADDDEGTGAEKAGQAGKVHSVGAALFALQCETLEICQQELNITRAGVLDYFQELVNFFSKKIDTPACFFNVSLQDVSPDRELFAWERDNYQMPPRKADVVFVKRIGHALCAAADAASITGEVCFLLASTTPKLFFFSKGSYCCYCLD